MRITIKKPPPVNVETGEGLISPISDIICDLYCDGGELDGLDF